MVSHCLDAIRGLVLQKAALGQTIDVYAVAQEFHTQYPDCSESELVELINSVVVAAPGVTAVWMKTPKAE